jgi:hypothetical protein
LLLREVERMKVLYSKTSKKVHRYDDGKSDERCNLDQILPEDRVVIEVPEDVDVQEWATSKGLTLCRRDFPAKHA